MTVMLSCHFTTPDSWSSCSITIICVYYVSSPHPSKENGKETHISNNGFDYVYVFLPTQRYHKGLIKN